MEFTCLHCRERLTVDDSSAGERIACPSCSGMVTVPKPIGGRLTDKRLGESAPEVPTKRKPPKRVVNEDEPAPVPKGPEQPQIGFRFETRLPKILGKTERVEMQECLNEAAERIQSHFEAYPQFFRSGAFILELDQLNVEPGGHQARFRLYGSLNGDEFNASATVVAGRAKYQLLNSSWAVVLSASLLSVGLRLVEMISFNFRRQATLRARFQRIVNSAVKQLCYSLDDAGERPLGLMTRFSRRLAELC